MYKFTIRHRVDTDENLLDPESLRQGFLWENENEVSDSNYAYSNRINITPNTVYQGNGSSGTGIFSRVAYYDINGRYISTFAGTNFSTFTSPAGAYYAVVSVRSTINGEPDPYLLSVTEGYFSPYTPYYRTREVFPSYKKLDRKIDQESGYLFYREKVDGVIKLLRSDYDYLDSLDFDQEIFLDIEDASNFFAEYKGSFYKTDCKWDSDNRTVEIKTDTEDDYTDILGGLDKTFNLIEEAPALQEITVKRRPIIQVYIPGDKVITNILGGSYWEQEIQIDPEFDHSTLVNTYKFFNTQNIRTVSTGYIPLLSTDITGDYDPDTGERVSGDYKLVATITNNKYPSWVTYQYHIVEVADTLGMGETWSDYALYETGETDWRNTSINSLVFNGVNGETGSFYFTDYKIYTRYYTDYLNVRGTDTYPIPSTDIVPNNSNYRRVIGYDMGTNQFAVYNQFETHPTKFGKVPNDAPNTGEYYKEFLVSVVTGLSNPVPVSSSNWRAVSLWFFTDIDIRYTEFIDGQDFELRDTYPLHSVIQTLLRAIGSSVTFTPDTNHSEILYATNNPLGNFTYLDFDGGTLLTTSSGNLSFFISVKSNILAGDYDQPANKADISLGQVLKMLRDTMKLEWFVEDGRLKIEHVSWFQKGGSYTSTIVGTDLTTLIQPRNGKNWGVNQNKWEYAKEDMPERFEYGWMDDVSLSFEGFPIEMISGYVQKGRIEDKTVNGFSTDIDFITGNPQEISKEGFVIIGCILENDEYRVPYIEYNLGFNSEVILQNGFLSWLYLHPKYHLTDLPSNTVKVNNTETSLFDNITKRKKQEISYPATESLDPYKLVKTDLGNGTIDKLTISMESRMIKATIRHDTE